MKLLIIDSNSILNRAFYGIRGLTAKDGTPTNAVYGFLNILIKLIRDVEPDYICAAFDVKAPTFRHEQYKEYKAQRKPMPDDLAKQLPLAKQILSAMNISVLELAGYEADDIIGTVSRVCTQNGVECYIATGDKDDLQLVDENVRVILTVTRSGVNETVVYDEAKVAEKLGVSPTEYIDVKALMGDSSDNIPGVSGVGEKTAFSLISKYKSIEYIYDNIDNVGLKGVMLERMKNGRESAFLSKQLATIDRNVPMDINLENYAKTAYDNDTLYELLKKLDLHSIVKKLALAEPDEVKAVAEDFFEKSVMTTVSGVAELDALVKMLSAQKMFSIMFDFAGENLAGFSVAVDMSAYFVSVGGELTKETVITRLLPILRNADIEKYVFDIKEALVKLYHIIGDGKKPIENIAFDAAIAVYLINPARSSYDLPSVAAEHLGVIIEKDENGGQMSLFGEDNESCGNFACKKVLCIKPLAEYTKQQMHRLGQEKLYYDIELPLIQVLADMQIYGFKIDNAQLDEFSVMLTKRIEEEKKEIYSYAGEEFNVNSPRQLGEILFEKLGLKSGKKTKRGYSTNAEVLEKLKGEHPVIEHIMQYRVLAKLKSTYCDGLKAVINPQTGRIHSIFTQTVTLTGRISSAEPNMQNIPVRTELGREIRKMFTADGDDYILTDADYSQIELRVLAHIADDPVMIKAFMDGEDIHTVTASQVFGVPISEVTGKQRGSAKAVNFGIVYGMGEFSLAQDLKISVIEARQYMKNYLDKYSGVRDYMADIKKRAKEDGYVKTMMNRVRYIPEISSSNRGVRMFGERVALNTPIQGSAADIIKLAMVRVHRRLNDAHMKSRLILQVHDELIVETHKDEVDAVKEILKTEMENAMQLKVPLIADMNCGKSWYDAK